MKLINDTFGPGGHLARTFPNYTPRRGQQQLATEIARAIEKPTILVAEAPCGTGKSFAYLAPAVAHAVSTRRCVVVATANIALQEQLIQKDLPALQKALPFPFRYTVLKGRSNYLCQYKVDQGETLDAAGVDGFPGADREELDAILAWAAITTTGDRADPGFLTRPSDRTWRTVSMSSEDCHGDNCVRASTCFANKARTRAWNGHIIVANYHLLFAHLAVREATGENLILPHYDVLILDEAHEAADIAREFFGMRVTEGAFKGVARELTTFVGNSQLADVIRAEGGRLFDELSRYEQSDMYEIRLKQPGFVDFQPAVEAVDAALEMFNAAIADFKAGRAWEDIPTDERAEIRGLTTAARRADRLASALVDFSALSNSNLCYWIERVDATEVRLRAQMINVGPKLTETLFPSARSTIALSAAMTTTTDPGRAFAFVRSELGIPASGKMWARDLPDDDDTHSHAVPVPVREVTVPTPFDFKRQALLVVPHDLPLPGDRGFDDAVVGHLVRVVDVCRAYHATRGKPSRILSLHTSKRVREAAYERLRNLGVNVIHQDEAPPSTIASMLTAQDDVVLLATRGLWHGFDAKGLTAVVIDKFPFPNPKDPLIDAINSRVSWGVYNLPKMIMAFRQGAGRLIRSASDVGAIVLLDRRVFDKGYGAQVLRTLPTMQGARQIEYIPIFFDQAISGSSPAAAVSE